MATTTPSYGTKTTLTLDLSSLGTSASFVAGVESVQVDNTTDKFMDFIVSVDGITGHASTAPTIGQQIVVYAWGSDTSLATRPIDVLDGTSSAETLGHVSVLNSLRFVAAPTVTVATAALKYWVPTFSIASVLGLPVAPAFWGLFVAHNHTGALGASNNNLFTYQGIKYDTA